MLVIPKETACFLLPFMVGNKGLYFACTYFYLFWRDVMLKLQKKDPFTNTNMCALIRSSLVKSAIKLIYALRNANTFFTVFLGAFGHKRTRTEFNRDALPSYHKEHSFVENPSYFPSSVCVLVVYVKWKFPKKNCLLWK